MVKYFVICVSQRLNFSVIVTSPLKKYQWRGTLLKRALSNVTASVAQEKRIVKILENR